jgi:glycosyltransferase involved in cell wall biosynthesis
LILDKFLRKKKHLLNIGYLSGREKTVLVSYLSDAFFSDASLFKYNTNRCEMLALCKSLLDLGYSVDVYDCLDFDYKSKKEYDLIIGFGFPYRKAAVKNNGERILYCTEAHPNLSIQKEKERIKYFYERHSFKFPLERSGKYYLEQDYNIADKMIVMGEHNRDYLRELGFNNIYKINPTAINTKLVNKINNGRDFIWLGSRGVVHKGLDILIDVFNQLKITLHVCGADKKYIESKLKMKVNDNIIIHGKVDTNSDYFNDNILKNSSFIIMPSCSEGVSTSVLTGMRLGLVPVVTHSCGINIDNFGFYLDSFKVDEIKDRVLELSIINKEELVTKSIAARAASLEKYCLNSFVSNIKSILVNR